MWPYQIYKDASVLQLHSLFLLCQPVMISLSGRHKLGKVREAVNARKTGTVPSSLPFPGLPPPLPFYTCKAFFNLVFCIITWHNDCIAIIVLSALTYDSSVNGPVRRPHSITLSNNT